MEEDSCGELSYCHILCFQEMGEGFLLSPPSQCQGSKDEEEFKSKIQVLKDC